MYSYHFLLSSAASGSILFLSFIVPICMKFSLGISNFLEEISSISHSIFFPLYLCLVHQGDFLIFPCHFLELCTEMGIFSFSSLPFASLLFSAICNDFSDNHFAYLHFFFLWMVLIFTSSTIL